MDSKNVHSPVFLVFPPEIITSEYRTAEFTATAYDSQNQVQKILIRKLKILGTTQILFGIMNFSFGVVFLFTLVNPYPRFPFIFLSGYPFWGSALFINSGAFLIALKRKTTDTLIKMSQAMNLLSALGAAAGIILLIFAFLLDGEFICGYSPDGIQCGAITTLFVGILIMLMIFSVAELFISLFSSILGCYSEESGGCC
ncbi:rCG63647 [Rattus norvegicus]|uniref:Membrane spanning 4-domains A5 n=2 Tax=Rattus norvegicus TaxID=10116 RepID=D3ZJ02_RAT|nr:membrane spanning 4-domains A5 [Rattus norvegicus]EDM12867.1 rCG63647 [Rattus norvegicus]QHI05888.1 membrane-spanning 4-domains subfamily A member 5 [Rattus norvegicus]|eukprot:XP_003749114.1 PREDICTED: membrane-spanning 4-domains subfamily A member 5 [Rattus norvegicus]